jgi:hypothetical protein
MPGGLVSQRPFARAGEPVTEVNATAGNETVTLSHGFTPGRTWTVERIDGSANTVTVTAESGDTLNGTADGSISLPAWESVTLDRLDAGWRTRGFGGGEASAATGAPGTDAWLKVHAGGDLDALLVGAITRDSNGAATSAGVVWPDGTTGTYTATTVSTAFPGAVDAFTVTYAGSTTKTVTQPAVTRDETTGAVVTRPAMTVS